MTDLPEAPYLYMLREHGGGYSATLRDGTVIRYRPPYDVSVILPTPELTASFEKILAEAQLRSEKAARPAKAVAIWRENPKLTYSAIAKTVKASPASVSKWIKAETGGNKPAKAKRDIPQLTETEMAAARAQALREFTQRGGACTRGEIEERAQAIMADLLRAKRVRRE